MSSKEIQDHISAERRKFERIDIAREPQVLVLDPKGNQAGVLRRLSRGGFMMETASAYPRDAQVYQFTIHEQEEDIRISIRARVRSADPRTAGFEFVDLDIDSAVDVGIIIGKNYEAAQNRKHP